MAKGFRADEAGNRLGNFDPTDAPNDFTPPGKTMQLGRGAKSDCRTEKEGGRQSVEEEQGVRQDSVTEPGGPDSALEALEAYPARAPIYTSVTGHEADTDIPATSDEVEKMYNTGYDAPGMKGKSSKSDE